MKTAVEYLVSKLFDSEVPLDEHIYNAIEQAKEMEKEQIKDAWDNGCNQTLNVSGYKLGNTILALTYKPKWIHRKMMKIFFGVQWVDRTLTFKQQEQ